jgi:glucokinase
LIASAKNHTKAIVEAASDPKSPSQLCRATIDMLLSILASEAGNFARAGSIWLAGLHLLSSLQEPRFMQAFARKGRFKDLMGRIPVRMITTRDALVGAASFGLKTYKHESGVAA